MSKFKYFKYMFFMLVFSLFLVPAIDCTFISGSNENTVKLSPFGTANRVAYIGSTNYVTIESALRNAKSGDKVYVVPGTNPIINQNCVVKSGVELYIPYENEIWENKESAGLNTFSDSTSTYVNTYRKNEVKINTGVSLTIESGGALYIGGQTGNTSMPMQGHTSGKYSQITLYNNAKILNSGNVFCYGYIKEQTKDNGSIFASYSGNVYAPLVIYDFRGGSSTAAVYKADPNDNIGAPISPFNTLDMPNIQTLAAYYYGTNLYGCVNLYTGKAEMSALGATATINARYNCEEILVIGSSNNTAMFSLENGGYITTKVDSYFDDNGNCLTNNTLSTKMDFYNNASFNMMSLPLNLASEVTIEPSYLEIFVRPTIERLLNTTITTEDVYFPVSYKMNIILHEGNFKGEGKLKFLPGSSMLINEGATLTLKDAIFYTEFIDTEYNYYVYPTKVNDKNLERAKITVNGNLILNNKNDGLINSGTGGIMDTSHDGAILSVMTNNLDATSYDGHGSREGITFTFVNNATSPRIENLRGIINGNNTNSDGTSNLSQGYYVSQNGKWTPVDASELGTYTLNFDANGGNYFGESSVTVTYLLSSSNPKIETINVPNPSKNYYEFIGRYIEGTDTPAIGYPITNGGVYNLIAHYAYQEFNINYSIQYDEGLTSIDLVNNNPNTITYADILTGVNLTQASDSNYNFYGWFTNPEFSDYVTSFNENILLSALDNNTITLYGRFTTKDIYNIELYDSDDNLYQTKKLIANTEYVDLTLPSDLIGFSKSEYEGTYGTSDIIYKNDYNYDGWSITNGTFDGGSDTIGNVLSTKVKGINNQTTIIKPHFSINVTNYYKLTINVKFNSDGLAKTSASITVTNCLFNSGNEILEDKIEISSEIKDHILYIKPGTNINIAYSGDDAWIFGKAEITILFSGFTDDNQIGPTTGKGEITRTSSNSIASITVR